MKKYIYKQKVETKQNNKPTIQLDKMAAVICRAIAKPFELCGKACAKSCEACGKCCNEMEKECTKCCGPCCAEINKCCGGFCDYMSQFLDKPFSSLVIFTFLAAFAPAFCLFGFMADCSTAECQKCQENTGGGPDLFVFGIVQAILFLIHFFMAIYIMRKFDKPMTHYGDTFYQRLCHLVCEDVAMALYICILIFAFIWNILGMTWRNATSTCADHTYSVMVEVSITLSWIFFFFGGIAFAFAALQGSIDEGACTHNCGGPCVFCGRLCCGTACCPTDEEIAMRKQQQLQRDRERQAQMDQQGGPQQQNMNRNPGYVAGYQQPPQRQAPSFTKPMPTAVAQPVYQQQQQPVYVQTNNQSPNRPPRNQQQQGQPKKQEKDAGEELVDNAVEAGTAIAKGIGRGLMSGFNMAKKAAQDRKKSNSSNKNTRK